MPIGLIICVPKIEVVKTSFSCHSALSNWWYLRDL